MYFASRAQAGRMLAGRLVDKYQDQNCAVMALSDGGVMVGAQIAAKLRCVFTLLVNEEISLPREPDAIAGITQDGAMAYNSRYSAGEIDEMVGEYYNFVEQEKLRHMHDMNALVGKGAMLKKTLLAGHNVIVVSDGLKTGFPVDLAYEFLKPIKIKKLVVAVPLASVPAVDRMHVLADDLYCLSVVEEYMDTGHYYDKQDVPEHQAVLETINQVVGNWK